MKELVEIVAEEGGIPMLHYDADWDREIERLLELPGAPACSPPTGHRPLSRQAGATKPVCRHDCQNTPYSSTASRSAMTFSGLASSVIELAPSMMSPPVSPKSSISPLT